MLSYQAELSSINCGGDHRKEQISKQTPALAVQICSELQEHAAQSQPCPIKARIASVTVEDSSSFRAVDAPDRCSFFYITIGDPIRFLVR